MTLFRFSDGRRWLRIAAEIATLFAALIALDHRLTGGTGFVGIQPNPYWLPVLVTAVAYGTGPGVIAAAIASGLWLGQVHGNGGERDQLEHLFHLSLPPLLWFVAAVAIGEVTTLRAARQTRLARHERIARRNVARLTEAFETLSRTNRSLQVERVTEAGTLGHVVATASQLASLDPAARRDAIVQLIALTARTDDFTCYRITDDAACAWLRATQAGARCDVLPAALIDLLLRRRGMVHVARRSDRAVLEGVGVAAIPLTDPDNGDLIGCLVLHALPFAELNAGRVAELGEIGRWLAPLLADPPRAVQRSARTAGLVA